jgi:hypothetical protein
MSLKALVSAGDTVLGVVGLTEGYGEGAKFVEITAAIQKDYEPGTGEIPPNSLQVAPFAGPETLASKFTDGVCNEAEMVSRPRHVRSSPQSRHS